MSTILIHLAALAASSVAAAAILAAPMAQARPLPTLCVATAAAPCQSGTGELTSPLQLAGFDPSGVAPSTLGAR
jgi:hypothetical protein